LGSKESAGIARVGYWTVENESGATLTRPELFRLLSDAHAGDILLVEQVDRLSRLKGVDWERLKAELATRNVRVVALDLPTSWMLATKHPDEFTSRMFEAVNGMMLDMLAAVARKDYDDRRRRQNQGIAQAKAEGRYNGRPEDIERNESIAGMLKAGLSYSAIQAATDCSRATVAKIAKRIQGERPFEASEAA
jgi:DNA invertase Pin-like site-specific DNA recombinase